jgi:biopolymer transport protein ExbB
MSEEYMRPICSQRAGLYRLGVFAASIVIAFIGSYTVHPTAALRAQDDAVNQAEPPATVQNGAQSQAAPQINYLKWTYESLGLMYSIIFLALSFTFVALVVMNILTARRENVAPLQLVEGFEKCLNEHRYQEAYELARSDDSFLGRVLAAGMAKLSAGFAKATEAMQDVGEDETMKLEHRLSHIQLIASISPMVGLLGTVQGMIMSFSVIATSPTTPKPSQLAKGIETALFTTLVGLILAIPAIAAFNLLRNRISRLVLEVGALSGSLMNRFEKVEQKK